MGKLFRHPGLPVFMLVAGCFLVLEMWGYMGIYGAILGRMS